MEEIKKINLDSKYFKNEFTPAVSSAIIINTCLLIIVSAILFFIYNNFYSNFGKEYKLNVVSNFNREITIINNSITNRGNKDARINNLIKAYLKDKYLLSIWVSDNKGDLFLHSRESMKKKFPDLKRAEEYKDVFQYNWSFRPDGTVIPLIKEKKDNDYTETFCPVYNLKKKIDYIKGIRFKKYLSRSIYIPGINIYINTFYIIIISLCLLMILIIIFPLIIILKSGHDRQAARNRELITKLNESPVDREPFQYTFNGKDIQNNFTSDMIKYINSLLENFHSNVDSEKNKQNKIKTVLPPAIFETELRKEKIKVTVKPDDINLQQFLWGIAFKGTVM